MCVTGTSRKWSQKGKNRTHKLRAAGERGFIPYAYCHTAFSPVDKKDTTGKKTSRVPIFQSPAALWRRVGDYALSSACSSVKSKSAFFLAQKRDEDDRRWFFSLFPQVTARRRSNIRAVPHVCCKTLQASKV